MESPTMQNQHKLTVSSLTDSYIEDFLVLFRQESSLKQLEAMKKLIGSMDHSQNILLKSFLKSRLRTDIIWGLYEKGLDHLIEKIFLNLDGRSLCAAESVSLNWRSCVDFSYVWKQCLLRRLVEDPVFESVVAHDLHFDGRQHKCKSILKYADETIDRYDKNWMAGRCRISRIDCRSNHTKGVYCLQYDHEKIVCGLRDKTVKVWNRESSQSTNTATYYCSLSGHTGSVLCLQYCDDYLVTGSSDSTIKIWSLSQKRELLTIHHHTEAVLHVRFAEKTIVSSSRDHTIGIFEMNLEPKVIHMNSHTLRGHRAAVNAVDFDNRFIVSASGDRSIRIWNLKTRECMRTLLAHRRGIACLQMKGDLIVSGSSDNTVKIWNLISGQCLRTLEGHADLVRCIRFDDRRIISGSYDGILKIWDLQRALDTQNKYDDQQCCLFSNQIHTGRIFRIQFDHKLVLTAAHDDSIAFVDFSV
ncbi:hypothetical protein ACOME3_000824 [Neoechinorhynchus agilis]